MKSWVVLGDPAYAIRLHQAEWDTLVMVCTWRGFKVSSKSMFSMLSRNLHKLEILMYGYTATSPVERKTFELRWGLARAAS